MGKKKSTNKPASSTQTSTTGKKCPVDRTTMEARPASPRQSLPTPMPQAPAMVPLDALVVYLRQQDPNKDWTATLAGFSQTEGMPAIPTPTPEIPTTVNPLTTVPTSSTATPKKTSPTVTAPSASLKASPIHQQIEPLDVSPLSAYQDPDLGETEEKESEDKESERGEDKSDETPVVEHVPQEKEREEIDLNEARADDR